MSISNGESLSSVRTKLNASLTKTDAMDQGVATTDSPTFQDLSIIGSSTIGNLSLLDSTGTAGGRVVGDEDNKIGLRAGASGYVNVFEVRGDLNQAVLVLNSVQQALFTTSGTTLVGDLAVDTDTLYVDASTNRVGIGTTSPDETLHLKNGSSGATAYGYSDFYLEGSAVTGFNFLHSDTHAAGIYWSTPSDNLGAEIRWKYSDNEFKIGARSTNGFMSLYAGNSEKARLAANGDFSVDTDTLFVDASADRVGFNTSSPQATAHIIGSGGAVSGATYVGAADLIIEDTVHANLHLISNATSGISSIYFGDPDDADVGYIAYFHASNAMQLKTNGTVALTIDSAGLLNFGTHSAIASETVTGYVTIKDSGGTSRKLAVVS